MIFKEKIFELNGKKIVLRSPRVNEAKEIRDTFVKIVKETRFLVYEPEEAMCSIKQEEKIIRDHNNSKDSMYIGAYVNGKFVGGCSFQKGSLIRKSHRIGVGICILQKYTGFGLGSLMFKNLIEQVKEAGYLMAELDVMGENKRARHLYKKFGFKECGKIRNGFKYKDGTFDDEIFMVKKIS